MKSKIKKEIQQLLTKLRNSIPESAISMLDRLERLFGEVRREESMIKSEYESVNSSNNTLSSKLSKLSHTLDSKSQELQSVENELQRCRRRERDQFEEIELLDRLSHSIFTNLLSNDHRIWGDIPVEVVITDDVEEIMRRNPLMNIAGKLLCIQVAINFARDENNLHRVSLPVISLEEEYNLWCNASLFEDPVIAVVLGNINQLRNGIYSNGGNELNLDMLRIISDLGSL